MFLNLEMGFNFQLCKDTCQTFTGLAYPTNACFNLGRMIFLTLWFSCLSSGDTEHGLLDILPSSCVHHWP